MKTIKMSLLASGLIASIAVHATTPKYCASGADNVCFRFGIPQSSADSGSGNIYFQIQAPSIYSWVALGTGDQMKGSNMFVMYQDGTGNLTLSSRLGTGHSMPEEDTSPSAAALGLLAGSGVVNGVMVANVVCPNCETWNGGSLSLTDTASKWIAAWKSGSSLATTAISSWSATLQAKKPGIRKGRSREKAASIAVLAVIDRRLVFSKRWDDTVV